MTDQMGRRQAIGAAGAMLAGAAATQAFAQGAAPPRKVIGINGSPRKGMTTSAGLQVCLDAVKAADAGIETELIELGELSIPAYLAPGLPLKEGDRDDFPALANKLAAPEVAGIVVGSPVYFGNMSALCKAFLDRCIAFRKDNFTLAGKVAGVVAVGGARNGGQETTIQSIQVALSGQNMLILQTGQPTTRIGATFWNQNDSIAEDDFGRKTAQDLGRNIAGMTAKLAG